MSPGNQYLNDKKRLATLIDRLTGIPQNKILEHINQFGVGKILSGANEFCTTTAQREKLAKIFEFKNLYENVKTGQQEKGYKINSTERAKEYFINYFADIEDREHVAVACLDSKLKILSTKTISSGTVNSASIPLREVIKEALFCNAVNVILSHNHPSGVFSASREDISSTNEMEKALSCVGMRLIDHIIVCGDKALSMADDDLIRVTPIKELTAATAAVYEKREDFILDDSKRSSVRTQLVNAKNQRLLGTEGKMINKDVHGSR